MMGIEPTTSGLLERRTLSDNQAPKILVSSWDFFLVDFVALEELEDLEDADIALVYDEGFQPKSVTVFTSKYSPSPMSPSPRSSS